MHQFEHDSIVGPDRQAIALVYSPKKGNRAEDAANAALIVKAVNLFEAHEAVVEAARGFINILGYVSDDVQDEKNALRDALLALAALREKEGV